MTTKPKLMAVTPDSTDTNSLIDLHTQLIASPTARRYAIVELTVPKILEVTGGDATAYVQLTHIEVIESLAQQEQVVSILDAHYKSRTKNNARPGPNDPDTPLDLSGLDPDRAEKDAAFDAAAPSNVTELGKKK